MPRRLLVRGSEGERIQESQPKNNPFTGTQLIFNPWFFQFKRSDSSATLLRFQIPCRFVRLHLFQAVADIRLRKVAHPSDLEPLCSRWMYLGTVEIGGLRAKIMRIPVMIFLFPELRKNCR